MKWYNIALSASIWFGVSGYIAIDLRWKWAWDVRSITFPRGLLFLGPLTIQWDFEEV